LWPASPWAPPASAALPGLQRVFATSAYDSSNSKGISVNCPQGKLLGPGARVNGGEGNVTINTILPLGDLNGVFVIAVEHAAYGGNWSVTAEAVCADPLPGLEMVTRATPSTTNQQQSVTVSCPAGKNIIGAGFRLHYSSFQGDRIPRATRQQIHSQLRSATIAALALNPRTSWQIEAVAVCAYPPPGLERRLVSTSYSANLEQVALAQCPTMPPKVATGSGFSMVDVTNLASVVDNYTCCGTTPTVALARGRRAVSNSTQWRVQSFVLCANP
jgi:hypothetical protein